MSALRIEGAIARPLAFDFTALAALPDQIDDVGTLVPGRSGGGIRGAQILDLAVPDPAATTVTLLSADASFVAEAPLAAVRDGIVVYRLGDGPLPDDLGGPLRFLLLDAASCAPDGQPSACANVKQLAAIRVEPLRT